MANLSLFKNVPKDICLKLASTKDELEQAYHLIYDAYKKDGLLTEHISELAVFDYHLLPQTSVVIAMVGEQVVGTVTLINGNSFMLPLFHDQNRALNHMGQATKAQIIDMVVSQEFKNRNINFLLLKYLYEYCSKYLNIQNLVISVHPSKIRTYRKLFGFLPMTDLFYDTRLNGHPSVGLFLNLQDGYDYLAINFGKLPEQRNTFFYFTKYDFAQFFHFPERQYYSSHDPVMSPEIMNYFFNYKTSLLSSLSNEQLETLHYHYTHDEYKEVIPQVDFNITFHHMRRSRRFPVACDGLSIHHHNHEEIIVNSVSRHGLSLSFHNAYSLKNGDHVELKLRVSKYNIITLRAEMIWKKTHLEYGFKLCEPCSEWDDYINYLDQRFEKLDLGYTKEKKAA